jgi:hypothetical protein
MNPSDLLDYITDDEESEHDRSFRIYTVIDRWMRESRIEDIQQVIDGVMGMYHRDQPLRPDIVLSLVSIANPVSNQVDDYTALIDRLEVHLQRRFDSEEVERMLSNYRPD